MDERSVYAVWLDDFRSRDGLFGLKEEGNFRHISTLVVPLLLKEAERCADSRESFFRRANQAHHLLADIYQELVASERGIPIEDTYAEVSGLPRWWWAHRPIRSFYRIGSKTTAHEVRLDAQTLSGLTFQYLSLPWMRHPVIDRMLLDAGLSIPALQCASAHRRCCAEQAWLSKAERTAPLDSHSLWLLESKAAMGRARVWLAGVALFYGGGLALPLGFLWFANESEVSAPWVGIVALLALGVLVLFALLIALGCAFTLYQLLRRALGRPVVVYEKPSEKNARLEREATTALEAYALLEKPAIPLLLLRERVRAVSQISGIYTLDAQAALVDRAVSLDGPILVPVAGV